MADTKFGSVAEELEWFKSKYEESQLEMEEFQVSSKELEMELETQLGQLEKENRELKTQRYKLEAERDLYAEKFTMATAELRSQLEELEEELKKERDCNERMNRHIRELEQNNDDLERAKRALAASLEVFDGRLNNAIERNAFLESELDEKEQLSTMVQRLKEETRDLKQELSVQQQKQPLVGSSAETPSNSSGSVLASQAPSSGGIDKERAGGSKAKTPLGNSGRANALDIVNDLLRKVGTLMNVALTPPPSRRRANSKKLFSEANNNHGHGHAASNAQMETAREK